MVLFGESQEQIEPEPVFRIFAIAGRFEGAIGDGRYRVSAMPIGRRFYRLIVIQDLPAHYNADVISHTGVLNCWGKHI
ncbi:Hypothetical protein MLTONO_p0515 (plasmid) [Mesorhizobium loti]|nr:Hypothetical protein MLTONO_p0515 [Mesorhizobium loti]